MPFMRYQHPICRLPEQKIFNRKYSTILSLHNLIPSLPSSSIFHSLYRHNQPHPHTHTRTPSHGYYPQHNCHSTSTNTPSSASSSSSTSPSVPYTTTHEQLNNSTTPASLSPTVSLSDSLSSSQRLTVRQKCDPYEQKGQPLPLTTINQLKSNISNEWMYDESIHSMYRIFTFQHIHPSIDFLSISRFITLMTNLCINQNHYVQSYTVEVEHSSVIVVLHTSPLNGMSYNDFYIAMQLDSVYDNIRREQIQQQPKQSEENDDEGDEGKKGK